MSTSNDDDSLLDEPRLYSCRWFMSHLYKDIHPLYRTVFCGWMIHSLLEKTPPPHVLSRYNRYRYQMADSVDSEGLRVMDDGFWLYDDLLRWKKREDVWNVWLEFVAQCVHTAVRSALSKQRYASKKRMRMKQVIAFLKKEGVCILPSLFHHPSPNERCLSELMCWILDTVLEPRTHLHMVQLLTRKGATLMQVTNDKGETPLQCALQTMFLLSTDCCKESQERERSAEDVVHFLVEKRKADTNALTPLGFSPLHYAIPRYTYHEWARLTPHDRTVYRKISAQLTAYLLANGADARGAPSAPTRPLHHACALGCTQTVDLLVQHGADVNAHVGDHYEGLLLMKERDTPLQCAATNPDRETRRSILQRLLNAGANPNVLNVDWECPLARLMSTYTQDCNEDEWVHLFTLFFQKGCNDHTV